MGLAILLEKCDRVSSVQVFCPFGSRLPPTHQGRAIRLVPCWEYDDPVSLLRTAFLMARHAGDGELILFNVFLRSFGLQNFTNGVGLILPTLVRFLARRKVTVYIHNFVETQDLRGLGYESQWESLAGRILERFLLLSCDVVCPLPSQATTMSGIANTSLRSIVVPYVEAIAGDNCHGNESGFNRKADSNRVEVLLFGAWGPQKDLRGGLEMLNRLRLGGIDVHVTVAGSTNSGFPGYIHEFWRTVQQYPTHMISVKHSVTEEEICDLFTSSDILFLPYNAAGGYSAVMNIGAYYRLPIVSYDLPSLREFARIIGADCHFIQPGDVATLRVAVEEIVHSRLPRYARSPLTPPTESILAAWHLVSGESDGATGGN